MIRLTISIIVFAILSSIIIADDPCVFRNEKGVIDITSLGRNDGRPKYPDRVPPTGSNYKYSYNPCEPFSEGNDCQGVAACQISMDGLYQFAIGTQNTAVWNAGSGIGGNPSVTYTSGIRRAQIMFECLRTGDEEFEALGEDPSQPGSFKFRLAHLCACWNGCNSTATTTATTTVTTTATTDSCGFTDVKGVIDLTSLGRSDGKPAFADQVPPTGSNYKYSYNPCQPFSEGTECQGVAACQISMDGFYTFPLGTQRTAVWSSGGGIGGNPSVTYSYGEKTVQVSLECMTTEGVKFEALGEEPVNVYKFRLAHKCACWNGCNGTTTTTTTATTVTTTATTNSCRFTHEKGVIDITSLGLTNGRPKYPDRVPPTGSNYKYSYNPCEPFSEGRDCQGVAACQISMDGLYQFAIGTQNTAVWNAEGGIGGNPSVTYTSGIRRAQIMFECLRTGGEEFEALGEDPSQPGFYKFRLAHLCACWDGCKSTTTNTTKSLLNDTRNNSNEVA